MKKCKCGQEIQDKYIMCASCANAGKSADSHSNGTYLEVIQQINWNLGMISKVLQQLLPQEKLKQLKQEMKQKPK